MDARGAIVRDVARMTIGRVHDVLLDPATQGPRWLQVMLDSDGSTVLIPAAAASECAPGELLVPYPADVVAAAHHPQGEPLTETDATRLRQLYGFTG